MEFIKNAFEELKKVTVPPTDELVASTLKVVFFMFFVSFCIFLMDFFLGLQTVSFSGIGWKGLLGLIYTWF